MPYKDPDRERARSRRRSRTPTERERKKRWKAAHREQANYEARVRYWKNPERAREKNRKAGERWRASATAPIREMRRQWKLLRQIEREQHRRDWMELLELRKTAAKHLDNPTLRVRNHGRSTVEKWPPEDDATRWLREHDERSSTTPPDVTPTDASVTNIA